VLEQMFKLLEAEQVRYGDTLPLVSENPAPSAFVHPTKKLKTKFPAGGLAPAFTPSGT
jgi:hypothetical protein